MSYTYKIEDVCIKTCSRFKVFPQNCIELDKLFFLHIFLSIHCLEKLARISI